MHSHRKSVIYAGFAAIGMMLPAQPSYAFDDQQRAELIDLLVGQVTPCFSVPSISTKTPVGSIVIGFSLDRSGAISDGPIDLRRRRDKAAVELAEVALRAVKQCAPYNLPKKLDAYYSYWNVLNIDFGEPDPTREHEEITLSEQTARERPESRKIAEDRALSEKLKQEQENSKFDKMLKEAKLPIGQLRISYHLYMHLKECYEARKGYAAVFINDHELDVAREAIRSIERRLVSAESSIDAPQV
jgi:hypothetical protein